MDAQLGEGFTGRVLKRVGAGRDGHAGQRTLDKQPVAPNVLPGAQRHLRLLHIALDHAQAVLGQHGGILIRRQPLHRRRLAVA